MGCQAACRVPVEDIVGPARATREEFNAGGGRKRLADSMKRRWAVKKAKVVA